MRRIKLGMVGGGQGAFGLGEQIAESLAAQGTDGDDDEAGLDG